MSCSKFNCGCKKCGVGKNNCSELTLLVQQLKSCKSIQQNCDTSSCSSTCPPTNTLGPDQTKALVCGSGCCGESCVSCPVQQTIALEKNNEAPLTPMTKTFIVPQKVFSPCHLDLALEFCYKPLWVIAQNCKAYCPQASGVANTFYVIPPDGVVIQVCWTSPTYVCLTITLDPQAFIDAGTPLPVDSTKIHFFYVTFEMWVKKSDCCTDIQVVAEENPV